LGLAKPVQWNEIHDSRPAPVKTLTGRESRGNCLQGSNSRTGIRRGVRTLAKPEWGTKRICQSCSTPFYDLQRDPIVCPKCEAVFDPEAILKSRKLKGAEEPEPPKKEAAKPEEALETEEEDALLDDDDDVLEDASDLEDEDVGAVIETADDKEEDT
jgi:uncharacterized protein (TIGR02300 family)